MNSSFFVLENFPNKGDKNEEPRLSSKEKLLPTGPFETRPASVACLDPEHAKRVWILSGIKTSETEGSVDGTGTFGSVLVEEAPPPSRYA